MKYEKLVELYKDNPEAHIYHKGIKVDFAARERDPASLNILMEKFLVMFSTTILLIAQHMHKYCKG